MEDRPRAQTARDEARPMLIAGAVFVHSAHVIAWEASLNAINVSWHFIALSNNNVASVIGRQLCAIIIQALEGWERSTYEIMFGFLLLARELAADVELT